MFGISLTRGGNKEIQERRTRREMRLSRDIEQLEDTKSQLEQDINGLNNELIKLHKRKADLAVEIVNSIQDYQEQGYQPPSVEAMIPVTGGNYTDIISGFVDDPKLGIPKIAQGAIKKFLEERAPMLNSMIDGVVNEKLKELNKNIKPPSEIEP